MSIINEIKYRIKYRKTWATPVGQDCINLGDTLCKWLGERLLFTAEHGNTHPFQHDEVEWRNLLIKHGEILLAYGNRWENDTYDSDEGLAMAEHSLCWVAAHLGSLWD